MNYRPHPITIFANLWRVFYLIIIPFIRGFLAALQGGLLGWLQGAWMDLLVFVFMIAVAVLRWYCSAYHWDEQTICVHSGVLVVKKAQIPWDKIVTVSLVDSFYLHPFGAVRFRADTLGGSYQNADFSMLLSHRRAQELIEYHKEFLGQDATHSYIPKTSSVVSLAMLSSNSLAGVIFIATFVSQSGQLLGDEFSGLLIGTFEEVFRALAFGIPPAAAAIAYTLLAGWFIGFLLTVIRYKDFMLTRQARSFIISGGIFTRREYCIQYDRINFIDIRQNIISKFLRLHSLYISAIGYGKQKDDISCIILSEKEASFAKNCDALFPTFRPVPRQMRSAFTGIMRFVAAPLSLCLGIPLVIALTLYLFPSWNDFIWFVGLMLMVPSLLFLVVRILDFVTGGFSVQDSTYTLRYSKAFILHTVVIPAEKVVKIQLRQGFFQKFGPNCDLILYTIAEKRNIHRCRNLNKAQLMELLSISPH